MPETLQELLTQRQALDDRIAQQKPQAVAEIKVRMATLGVTLTDLAEPRRSTVGRPVPPKFRSPTDPNQTWSGRGLRPKWMEALLATGVTMREMEIR